MMSLDCDHRADAGAYVLNALGDAESHDFVRHMKACHACRTEVAKLQVVVDTLPVAAPQVAPPPELKDRIMAVVNAEAAVERAPEPAPRRRAGDSRRFGWFTARPAFAGALACALLLMGVVAGTALEGGSDGEPTRTLASNVPNAKVVVTGDRARVVMTGMAAPSSGRVYQVWLKREGQAPEPTHTLFTVRGDGRATVEVDETVKDIDELLITAEPDGGSLVPTSQPVVRAQLT